MKRLIPLLFVLFALKANAQFNSPLSKAFGVGFELGVPSTSIYTIGTGVSGKFEFPVSNKVSVTLTGGYDAFFYKGNLYESSRTPAAAVFVPLKAGAKYFINQGVYLEGELGTAIETNYLKQDLFAFSIGPGFLIPINEKHDFDLGFRYENWSDHQVRQTSIRFAYRLGW